MDTINISEIQKGVSEHKQLDALHAYFDWLIDNRYSEDATIETLLLWNRINKPPMHPEDLMAEVMKMLTQNPKAPGKPNAYRARIVNEPILAGPSLTDYDHRYSRNIVCFGTVYFFNDNHAKENGWEPVTTTILPSYQIKELAMDSGAYLIAPYAWAAPPIDPDWAIHFKDSLLPYEDNYRTMMRSIPNQFLKRVEKEIAILDHYPDLFDKCRVNNELLDARKFHLRHLIDNFH